MLIGVTAILEGELRVGAVSESVVLRLSQRLGAETLEELVTGLGRLTERLHEQYI